MILKRGPKLGLLMIAFLMSFALAPGRTKVVHADGDDVSLTGCVIQGNDGDNGFLLTNVLPSSVDMSTRSANRTSAASETETSGTLPGASRVYYLLEDLDNDDDLPNYSGKRVEVRGELEGDIKKGEMEVKRDGDWVNMEIKSHGKTVKTRIPWVSVMPNPTTPIGTSGTPENLKENEEIELNINVRKLDVKDVKIVSGSCS